MAYNFNLGTLPEGRRRHAIRAVAPAIDAFVVHSPNEVIPYAEMLGIPSDRIHFLPLQRGEILIPRNEDTNAPFLLAMGSAGRDYETLLRAVAGTGIRTVIVTRPDIAAKLRADFPYVEFRSGLTSAECTELLAHARLSVTPIGNLSTASGQVTFLEAMRMGVPLIATRCPGTDGYIDDGHNGFLVPPHDVAAMRDVVTALWHDQDRRAALSLRQVDVGRARFSDKAAAERLVALLHSLGPTE